MCSDPLRKENISHQKKGQHLDKSSVKAGSCAGVVQADLVSPTGDAGLGLQGGRDGLNAALLADVGSVQAGC